MDVFRAYNIKFILIIQLLITTTRTRQLLFKLIFSIRHCNYYHD